MHAHRHVERNRRLGAMPSFRNSGLPGEAAPEGPWRSRASLRPTYRVLLWSAVYRMGWPRSSRQRSDVDASQLPG